MSARADGGPAFPTPGYNQPEGITLRDYFAAKAMQGLYANPDYTDQTATVCAQWAYELADAMLAAREAVKPVEQPAREVLSDDLSKCQRALMDAGKPYPKTCPVCGLGGKCKREGGAA